MILLCSMYLINIKMVIVDIVIVRDVLIWKKYELIWKKNFCEFGILKIVILVDLWRMMFRSMLMVWLVNWMYVG